MPDILHDFVVNAPVARVFDAFARPVGLNSWWTLRSAGAPQAGGDYEFYFGESFDWRGSVSRLVLGHLIEWTMTKADADWTGTRVGAEMTAIESGKQVRFWHCGWPEANAHFRTSTYCWALYLRLMRRWVELGEVVPYARRLDV